jgi:hypothetical protein
MKITFYRTASNSNGEPYHAKIVTIELPSGFSKEAALVAATKQLQEQLKVAHWQDVAEFYDISQ